MCDLSQRVDVVVCPADGGGRRGHDAQRPHAFLAGKGNLFLKSVRAHPTVFIALDFDDVLMANSDDVGRH